MTSPLGPRCCARPLCRSEAAATLIYDYSAAAVRLDHLSPSPHPMEHDLCETHADRLVLPRGWVIEDRRHPPEAIFRVKSPEWDRTRSVA